MSAAERFNCFPNPEQRLLLKACIHSEERGFEAYLEWKSLLHFDLDRSDKLLPMIFDQLDDGSRRLLPYLYKKYQGQFQDPIIQSVKGYYRHCWYKNQILIHELKGLIRQLKEVGIQTMLTKGMALSYMYYQDFGSRPMSDLDLVVPEHQQAKTLEIIQKSGWVDLNTRKQVTGFSGALSHSRAFVNQKGYELDIHWKPIREALNSSWVDELWESSIPLEFDGLSTSTLHATDQLLHTFLHGMEWNKVSSIRWVLDATKILQAEKNFDWELMRYKVQKRQLAPFFQAGFHVLDEFENHDWCKQLDLHQPASRLSKYYFKLKTKRRKPGDLTFISFRLVQLRLFYSKSLFRGIYLLILTFSWNWSLKGNPVKTILILLSQVLRIRRHPSVNHGSK